MFNIFLLDFETLNINKRDVVVKHRYLISFFTTTLFYLLLAGTYFYVHDKYLISDQKPQDQVIQLSLATCVPEVVPPVEEPEEIEEEPVVEEEIIEEPEPEPVVEEKPVPEKIIPEPIEPKIVPKPVIEKVEKKPVVKKKKKKIKKKVRKKAPQKTTKGRKRAGSAKKNNAAKKSQFLAQVRRNINKHKSYPKIAKRRGMQGKVKVRFTILANGNVGHISVKGPKVFHNSARRAVKKSFPISTRNIPISLPTSVNLTLHYQLR